MSTNTDFWPWIRVECLRNGAPVMTKESYFNADSSITHLGKLNGNIELRATVKPSGRCATIGAFEGRGHGQLTPKKDQSEKAGVRVFSKHVQIRRTSDRINPPFTRYPENHFRVLEVKGNQLRHFEVALVAQNGKFFMVKQLTRQGELFRDHEVVFPALLGWEEFTEFLTRLVKDRALKSTDKAPLPPAPLAPNGLSNFQGRVLWWNLAQQFGAVQLRNGTAARLHRSHLNRPGSKLAYASQGELVEFEKISLPNQTTERQTEFRQELYAATVINK